MDLQQLIKEATPGSIWMRTDGSRARVIAITNLSLPAESQQKYVPVVVYVGPSGKVFSRPLKDFAGYFPTWLGHDANAEDTIKSLLIPLNAKPTPVETPDDDAIDMSDDPVHVAAQEPRAKPTVQVRDKNATLARVASTGSYNDLLNVPAPPPVLLRAAFLVSKDESRKTPLVAADQLSRALRVYSQVPDEHLGLVVHKLSFELSPDLSIDNLKEVFTPDEWVNTVDAFRIGTPVSDETVNVDAYIGVYPEFTRNVLYGTVYVGVDMVQHSHKLEAHVHTESHAEDRSANAEAAQEKTEPPEDSSAPVETGQSMRVTESETVAVSGESAQQAPEANEASPGSAENASVEAVPQSEDVPAVGQAIPDEVRSETSAPKDAVKKPRKRRTKKSEVAPGPVEPVVKGDDEDIDVDSLS
jgi:hypothetical protein